jgi:hypothetical protein
MTDFQDADRLPCTAHDSFTYTCEDCQLHGVLEPDDIDQAGNRYPRYKEWLQSDEPLESDETTDLT